MYLKILFLCLGFQVILAQIINHHIPVGHDESSEQLKWPSVNIIMHVPNGNGTLKKIPVYQDPASSRRDPTGRFYNTPVANDSSSVSPWVLGRPPGVRFLRPPGVDYTHFAARGGDPRDQSHFYLHDNGSMDMDVRVQPQGVVQVPPPPPPRPVYYRTQRDQDASRSEPVHYQYVQPAPPDTPPDAPPDAPRNRSVQYSLGEQQVMPPIFWDGNRPMNISITQRDQRNKTVFSYTFDPSTFLLRNITPRRRGARPHPHPHPSTVFQVPAPTHPRAAPPPHRPQLEPADQQEVGSDVNEAVEPSDAKLTPDDNQIPSSVDYKSKFILMQLKKPRGRSDDLKSKVEPLIITSIYRKFLSDLKKNEGKDGAAKKKLHFSFRLEPNYFNKESVKPVQVSVDEKFNSDED